MALISFHICFVFLLNKHMSICESLCLWNRYYRQQVRDLVFWMKRRKSVEIVLMSEDNLN